MKKFLLTSLLVLSLCACTNKNDTENALNSQGFTDVKVTGYGWFSCGEGDFYKTKFEATNPKGERVKGTVCSGFIFKNSTVRW